MTKKDVTLENYGTFGCYSLCLLMLVSAATAPVYMMNHLSINFTGSRTGFRCHKPNDTTERNLSGSYFSNFEVHNSYVNISCTDCRDGYDYDTSNRASTYIMEWNLVCEEAWQTNLAGPVGFIGYVFGSIICGAVANVFGRKRSILFFLLVFIICGLMLAFSVNIVMFLLLRFIACVATSTLNTVAYVLVAELSSSRHRGLVVNFQGIAVSSGGLLLALLAYTIRQWRRLQLAITLYALPFGILIAIFVPESPRWLLWQGRTQETLKILTKTARRNRHTITPEVMARLCHPENSVQEVARGSSNKKSFRDLFTHSFVVRCFIIVSAMWCTAALMYHGVSLNLDFMYGDMYVNMCLISILEIASKILSMIGLRRLGHLFALIIVIALIVISGVLGTVSVFVTGFESIGRTAAILCHSSGAALNYITFAVIVELFPTSLRGPALGLAGVACYLVACVAPYIAGPLRLVWAPIPFVLYMSAAVILLISIACWLPQIKGSSVPRSVEELENLRNRTCWSSLFPERNECNKADHELTMIT